MPAIRTKSGRLQIRKLFSVQAMLEYRRNRYITCFARIRRAMNQPSSRRLSEVVAAASALVQPENVFENFVEEKAWIPDRWYRQSVQAITPTVREMQPANVVQRTSGRNGSAESGPAGLPRTAFPGIGPRRIHSRSGQAQVDGSRLPDHHLFRSRHRQPQDDAGL